MGFFDESSPQTTSNTQKLWSFGKPVIYKNTSKLRANTFGFYPINGRSVIGFRKRSKKEDIRCFLKRIRKANPKGRIITILDNFSSHKAKIVQECAENLDIVLVYLPTYSPDLNPIEYIWKDAKREISKTFIKNLNVLKRVISKMFFECSKKLSYAKSWINKFAPHIQKS
ncbi:MAG: hypothetical protein AEth_00430 [Candidatus Argoarchaeum ethanivorans]|uniref:Tc1-like transposase DDE domain-containing protein n=1 Tax=Candidatus Argoarchaeum ethanivorans TaxID=2608793 RepID=A0A8B3S3C1_9EURY|nr:MAG: hypothetical protein AEth_00430 [Candidatus Argoarchaeum ethanivorans]